jgi:hypothetical protein
MGGKNPEHKRRMVSGGRVFELAKRKQNRFYIAHSIDGAFSAYSMPKAGVLKSN